MSGIDAEPAGKRSKDLLSSQRLLERQQLFLNAEVKLKYLLLDALYLNSRVLGWSGTDPVEESGI